MESISIEQIGQDEFVRELTPLSLEACFREGVNLKDLAYMPPKRFMEQGSHPDIVEMRYKFFED